MTYLELFSVRINKKKLKIYNNLIKYMLKYAKIININYIKQCDGKWRYVTSCDGFFIKNCDITIFYFQFCTMRHYASQFVTASGDVMWRHNSSSIVRWRKNNKWCYSVVLKIFNIGLKIFRFSLILKRKYKHI